MNADAHKESRLGRSNVQEVYVRPFTTLYQTF